MLLKLIQQLRDNLAEIAPGVDKVYAYNLPKNEIENVNETIMLLSDVNANLGMDANNEFFSELRQIEIQIFFKLDPEDTFTTEITFLKYLHENKFNLLEVKGETIDPDTQQLTWTIYTEFELFI